jgi:hypothetical protein
MIIAAQKCIHLITRITLLPSSENDFYEYDSRKLPCTGVFAGANIYKHPGNAKSADADSGFSRPSSRFSLTPLCGIQNSV